MSKLFESTFDSEVKTELTVLRETSLSVLNQEVNQYKKQCDDFETRIHELERELKLGDDTNNRAQMEIYEMRERIQNLENQRQTVQREKNEILDELIDTRKKVERRENEIVNLNDELKLMSDKLCAEINAKYIALEKLQSIENLEIDLVSKEKRFEQERKYHLEQIDHLTKELNKRSKEVMNVRFQQSGKVELIEIKLAEKTEEVRMLNEANSEYMKENSQLKEDILSLNEQINEQRNNREILKESLQRELDSQSKLIELYKNSYEEEQNKTAELTDAIESLQNLMKTTVNEYSEREQEFKTEIETLKNEIIVKSDFIEAMKNAGADSLNTEEYAQMAARVSTPTRAAAYKFLKNGVSMTEVYSKFIDLTDELTKLQDENIRLQAYIDTLVKSVEEKAPIIQKEREEYDKSLEYIRKLQEENDALIMENCNLKSETIEARNAANVFVRENERRKQEIVDLSRQLCYLLNHQRNKLVPDADDNLNNLCASNIITKKLVNFKDIEELQENNHKLLVLVRELSSKQEEAESMDLKEIMQLKEDYQKISDQYKTLMDNYETQAKVLELTMKQRDSLKNSNVRDFNLSSSSQKMEVSSNEEQNITSTITTSNEIADELRLKLQQTESRLENLIKEYETYRIERKENERLLTEQLTEIKNDYQKVLEKNVKLTSSMEMSSKKINSLQMSLETFKKQVAALEDKNNVLNKTITKLEHTCQVLNTELLRANEKLATAEVLSEDLKIRNRLLQENEIKLTVEKENLMKNYDNRNMLSTNIEMIKTAIERIELENKIKLEGRLDEVLRECSALRRRLQEEQNYCRDQISDYDNKFKILKERYDEEVEQSKSLNWELQKAYADLKSKQELIDEINNKSNIPTPRITELMNENDINKQQICQLSYQLKDAELRIETLQKQLNESKEHVSQFKSLAETSELLLKDELEKIEVFKQEAEKQLREKEVQIGELKMSIEQQLNEHKLKIEQSVKTLDVDNSENVADLKDRIKCLQKDLIESNEMVKKLENEVQLLQEQAHLAEKNYANEIVSRAGDLEKTASIKENLLKITNQLNEEKSKNSQSIEMLKLEKNMFAEREKLLEAEREKLLERNTELEKQNDILHNEIETLNQRFNILNSHLNQTNISIHSSSELDDSSSVANSNNSLELLKVIKYLRKEKDLAIANLNLSKETHNRLESELKLQTAELNDLKALLNNKQQESEMKSIAASKYSELLKKVEMLNALTDSNRALRDERNELREKLDEINAKCEQLETIADPLNKQIQELSDKLDNLTDENNLLKNDCNRWKLRANLLIEKSKMSPDDFKKIQNERDSLVKMLSVEKESTKKLNEEINLVRNEKIKIDEKVTNITKQFLSQTEELNNLKKEKLKSLENIQERVDEVEKLKKEILDVKGRESQLRQIAKKYKNESLKFVQELEKLKQNVAVQDQNQLQQQQQQNQQNQEQFEQKIKDLESEYSSRIELLNAQISNKEAENQKLKSDIDDFRKSANDRDDRAKTVLSSARAKIVQLTDLKETLNRELNDAKSNINAKNELTNRLNSIKESLELQVHQLEQDKNAVVQEKEKCLREIDILNQKCLQMQRQGNQQTTKASTSCGTNTEKSSDAPPTANVKPITGNHSQSSSFSTWRCNETPLASIRPIAQPRLATVQPHQSQLNLLSATNSAIVAPHHQIVHTTDDNMSDFILSSPTSSHTEYMPATSSAATIHQRQACVMPTVIGYSNNQEDESAVSTQDIDNNDQQQSSSSSSSCSGQQQSQVVALVMPRMEQNSISTTNSSFIMSVPSTTSVSITTTISCQQASSSTTVTTSQANSQKRCREIESDNPQEDTGTKSPQQKRTRLQQMEFTDNSQGISESGIEVEYQVPTSSQRDQDDDIVIIDSNDEEEIVESIEEPDECNFDTNEDRELNYGDLDYQENTRELNRENNEVEILCSGSQNDNSTAEGQDANIAVAQNAEALSREQGPQSETISSGSDDTTTVSQMSLYTRSRSVQPMIRPQPAHTQLQHSYDDNTGDDSIVPCIPTSYVTNRRSDTFGNSVGSVAGEASCTPHAPPTHFPFNDDSTVVDTSNNRSSNVVLNQTDNQIEDLSTGRNVPNTPLQKSSGEQSTQQQTAEVNPETSPSESTQNSANVENNKDLHAVTLRTENSVQNRGNTNAMESSNLPEVIEVNDVNETDVFVDTASFEEDKSHLSESEIEEGREAEASVSLPGTSTNFQPRVTRLSLRSERNAQVRKTPITWCSENQLNVSRGGASNVSQVRGSYARGQKARRVKRISRF